MSHPAPIPDRITTVVDPQKGFALIELTTGGFSCPLGDISPLWAVSIVVLDPDLGPTAFPRAGIRKAVEFVDRILIMPFGNGFVSGTRVKGSCPEFQTDFLATIGKILSANRRCVAIRTNPSRLAEWEAVLHVIAPHVHRTVWRPEAINA